MLIGSKVYYAASTGNVIVITPEFSGVAVETTKEQDFKLYKALEDKVFDEVDFIQLEHGAYMFDRFEGGEIVRVDLETLEPLFNYPVKEGEEPKPPTISLESQISDLKQQLTTSNERGDKLAEENTLNQVALMELHAMMTSLLPEE